MELLVGVLCGVVGVFMFLALLTAKTSYLDKKTISKIVKEAEFIGTIKYRFEMAEAMQAQQLELISKLDSPSRGASHSRWKNDLVNEIQELEKNKLDIFRSMVADGIDPYLGVMDEAGELEKIKMSDAIARSEKALPPAPPKNKTESKSTKKNGVDNNVIEFNSHLVEKKNDKSGNPETNRT